MKYLKITTTYILAFIGLILFSCGTPQTALEKASRSQVLSQQIEEFNFKFNATYAYPQNYKSIYLSPFYDVKVSPDTVQAYLPYYGRAYNASMNPSEGGIKFISTEFKYEIEKGKKAGNWLVKIHTTDTTRPFDLIFDIKESGSGRLIVQDRDRQNITFLGDIEVEKKPK